MSRLTSPALDRVYHGDAAHMLGTWPSGSCDLLLCDPPYGNACSYGREHRRIVGDENPLVGLLGVAAAYRVLKRNATGFVFCAPQHVGFVQHFILAYTNFTLRSILVWDKGTPGFGYTFRSTHEAIAVLEKGKPTYHERVIPTVLRAPRASTRLHPHAKPVDLLERLIRASTHPGAVVLDPFAGSGSTGVAAMRCGRRFLGIEIASEYVEIANSRLKDAA